MLNVELGLAPLQFLANLLHFDAIVAPSYCHSYNDDGDDAQKREGIETIESCHRCPTIHRTDDAHQSEQHLYQEKQFQAEVAPTRAISNRR